MEKIKVRQFARGLKERIIRLMIMIGEANYIPGNLSRTMKLEMTKVTHIEALWASDFQTYNPECPTRVRNWLVKNYRSRFRKE